MRAIFRRLPKVDLVSALPDPDTVFLLLDRIPDVAGWKRLPELGKLGKISMANCATREPAPAGAVVKLDELYVHTLSPSCLKAIAGMADAIDISIWHSETPVLDLSVLRHVSRLRFLFLYCGLATGFEAIAAARLERLHVSNAAMDDGFRKVLESSKGTLRELWLANNEPLRPGDLPSLPHLKELRVPSHPETLEAWRAWRAEHPEVVLKFQAVAPPSAKQPATSIAEIHRDAAIMKVMTGKKTSYESWGDFTRLCAIKGDNHDIRAWLEKAAAKAKKKLKIHSEADEMGVTAAKIEDVRWAIDAMVEAGA
jgi:hypothetical protein